MGITVKAWFRDTVPTFEIATLEVCGDCCLAIEGYTSRETGDYGVDIANGRLAERWYSDGWALHNGRSHEDCDHDDNGNDYCEEPWFSWRSCESCGSSLGGNRHYATAMRKISRD